MKSRTLLFIIAFACIGLLAYALYLQHYREMLPCPLCVMQRYAFIAIALVSLAGAIGNWPKLAAGFSLAAAIGGAGIAIKHLWVQAHPEVSCGIDPLERMLNMAATANLWPAMFKADGMCTAGYEPILGLSIPQWSLAWFVFLSAALLLIIVRRR